MCKFRLRTKLKIPSMLRIFRKAAPDGLPDEALLRQYRESGDQHLLAALFSRHVPLVYGIGLKYFKDQQQAEDVCMAVYEQLVVKVLEHDIQHFVGWLHALARNHCLMHLRKAATQREENTPPELMQSADQRHHTLEWPEDEAQLKALRGCLSGLPPAQQQCIEEFYLSGYSYKEIAQSRQETVGRVRSYIQNGRRNLRICMEKLIHRA